MTYRNFRTSNSGVGNLFLTALMAIVGVIGLTQPNTNLGAADLSTPIPQPTIESTAAPDRARLELPKRAPEESSRVIETRNLTEETRTVRGIHHDRDYETPSTLVERGMPLAPSTTESFESDLGGIPLLPEAQSEE
ncbi:MAG: hypothetical protein RL417_966, partial [Pseudomonadota bacterium]|jgi:hypothetical protein